MFGYLRDKVDNLVLDLVGTGAPLSGTSGTGVGIAGYGCKYLNLSNGVEYWNEGTPVTPYWTPINILHRHLLGWDTGFQDGVGKAVADTAALYTIPGSGIRVFGNDVTQTDSGLTIACATGGPLASLVASATSGKLAALSVGPTTGLIGTPATNGPLVIDALISNLTAITARRIFCGFLGTNADALANPLTGATVTITLVQDDVSGLFVDTGLTTSDRWYAPHNKSDEAATILTTASGVDTGVTLAAAATYQRLRVEISAAGVMVCFIDKVQVASIAASAATAVALSPTLLITSLASATKTLLIKKFTTWGQR